MNKENLRKVYVKHAIKEYRASDTKRWRSALWCWMVVGKYSDATRGLASDMNVSSDTVEDLAHAYEIFVELGKLGPATRRYVFAVRNMPYIYYSHFRALHDAKKRYKLTIHQTLDMLHDIVQAEGQISSRDVDEHSRKQYGDQEDWTYDAQKLLKKLSKFNNDPDFPNKGRKKVRSLMDWIGHNA